MTLRGRLEWLQGFEAKRQEDEVQYGAGSYPYKLVFDPNTNAFVVYKELNGEEGYQAGKDDAKYVNGYYFTPSKMKRDGLYFNEQAKSLQSGTPWTIDCQPWNKQYGDLDNRWTKKKWFDAKGLVKPPSNSPYKKFTTWFKTIYDSVLPKGESDETKQARKAKPFLTPNAAYYANQITDGLADDICKAEGRGTVEAYIDATYQQANPQGQGQPYKYEISQLIMSKIKASADWKAEVKDRVTKVIRDGDGTRSGECSCSTVWIEQYGAVAKKKRTPEQFHQMWAQRQGAPTRVFHTQEQPIFSEAPKARRARPPPAEEGELPGDDGEFDSS
jgi:hypothetical protein